MGQDFSFDAVSKVDLQAVDNAINSAMREITNRFDFRGSISNIEFDKKTATLTLASEDEMKLKSVVDVLQGKLVKQGVSIKALDMKAIEKAENSSVRQKAVLRQGIASDKAKEIIRSIKDAKLKVNVSNQGDHVRVVSRSKDVLQDAIAFLQSADFGIPLQFTNYR